MAAEGGSAVPLPMQQKPIPRRDLREAMGVGKPLAILVMELARKEPGSFSLVVCTASCKAQWAKEIVNAYDEVSL